MKVQEAAEDCDFDALGRIKRRRAKLGNKPPISLGKWSMSVENLSLPEFCLRFYCLEARAKQYGIPKEGIKVFLLAAAKSPFLPGKLLQFVWRREVGTLFQTD